VIRFYYLHALQITEGTDHDPAPVPVMMRERISVEVARVVTNFLTVVSAARIHRAGARAHMSVRVRARVALPRLELAICAVVKGNGRCERTLPQVAG